jgi:FdhD protein
MDAAFRPVSVTRVRAGRRVEGIDHAATEEPLEVRLHGRPFAVIMRTPGADRELAAGFLFAEGVLKSADDLGTIEHCRQHGPTEAGHNDLDDNNPTNNPARLGLTDDNQHPENVVNVTLVNDAARRVDQLLAERRQVTTNSSCGLCGRLTIESLRTDRSPLRCEWTVARLVLLAMPDRLRGAQSVFDQTGGLHAAGLFTADGRLEQMAEDVGRHNAVDKVVGRMLMHDALPLSNHILFVSGRTSFEIVQKAFLAGISVVGSVSAPSSLAIDLAEDAGITLVGFVRGDSFNIYAHTSRIAD